MATLEAIHKSLNKYMVKDQHGNYPFWYRCSAIDTVDSILEGFQPVLDTLSLVKVKPRTSDLYALKQGFLLLKHNDCIYRYILDENMCDYDLQPFIDRKECWFKECETNKEMI